MNPLLKDSIDGALAIHPLADLIPGMTDADYVELRNDIAEHGLRQPVVLFEHMILDGRHRARACQETETEIRYEQYEGTEPAAHVLSLNLHRRHLTVSQRAMIATDFLPHLEEEAGARRATGLRRGATPAPAEGVPSDPDGPDGDRATGRAGQIVGVSRNSVVRAKRVKEEAPELVQEIREGTLTVTGANELVRERKAQTKTEDRENGRHASGRSVQRIASMAGAIAMAVDAIPLTKSCARLTDDERTEALQSCKQGLKALNALANSLGR